MTQTPYIHLIRVPYKDTDQMDVVHHGNYIQWFELARTEMMRNDGIAYKEMEQLGLLLPVLDVQIKYMKPAYYDDVIAIATTLTKFTAARMQFTYDVWRPAAHTEDVTQGERLATGTSLHMWVTKEWKPARFHKVAPDIYAQLHKKYGTR